MPIFITTWVLWGAVIGVPQAESRLSKEAPDQWKEYRTFAAKLQGTCTSTSRDMNDKVVNAYDATFKQSEFGRLCICYFTVSDKKPTSISRVWCSNKEYAFALERETPEKPWVVKNAAQKGTTSYDQLTASNNGMLLHLWECTGVLMATGKELLKRPAFKATSETVFGDPSSGLLRVDFTDEAGEHRFPVGGWIVFDTKNHWVVTKAETRYHLPWPEQRGDQIRLLEFEYLPSSPGYLIPVAAREKAFTLDKQETRGGGQNILDLSLSPIPADSEFKFAAFGLPELFASPSRPWYRYYYIWAIVAAVLCLGGALLLRKWSGASTHGRP